MVQAIKFNIARAKARQLIKKYHITKPSEIDLEAIAYLEGVLLIERPLKGADARLMKKGSEGIITVDSKIIEPGRKRFAAAHDLGHFELHKNITQMHICAEEVFLKWDKTDIEEAEANVFAAEFLLPGEFMKTYSLGKNLSFELIKSLANKFKTSITATAIRFVDYSSKPCCLIASKDNTIRWFSMSEDFPFRVKGVGTSLNKLSCAGEFFKGEDTSKEPEVVLASVWIEDLSNTESIYLLEDIMVFQRYNTVLSLLWLQE